MAVNPNLNSWHTLTYPMSWLIEYSHDKIPIKYLSNTYKLPIKYVSNNKISISNIRFECEH